MEKIALEDIWQIPENKINGERFGQLIFNSLQEKYEPGNVLDKLFYIENKKLEKVIKDYLEEK